MLGTILLVILVLLLLGALPHAEAWTDVQQGARSAWDELEKAVQDASREF